MKVVNERVAVVGEVVDLVARFKHGGEDMDERGGSVEADSVADETGLLSPGELGEDEGDAFL